MDEEEVAVAAQLLGNALRIAALLAVAALLATGLWLWRRAS
jgi:hypothetical protein